MLSLRRLIDRVTDRRPTIRSSRSRRQRRARRAWRLLLLLLAVLLAIAGLLIWSQPAPPAQGKLVEISSSATGEHLLNGKPVSLAELEARLGTLAAQEPSLFVAIAGPVRADGSIWPSPEVEAVLGRRSLSWMARPAPGSLGSASQVAGGEHGR